MAWHELYEVDTLTLTPDQLSTYLRAVNALNGSAQTARAKTARASKTLATGVAPAAVLSLDIFLKKP